MLFYVFTRFYTPLQAFKHFHTLSKCFYNASILLLLCFYIAFIHFHMLIYAFKCFHMHTLLYPFIWLRFYMLSYAYTFICFHTLSYVFICFHKLSYAFYMLLYAFTCFYMLLLDKLSEQEEQEMLPLCLTGFYLRKPVIIISQFSYQYG